MTSEKYKEGKFILEVCQDSYDIYGQVALQSYTLFLPACPALPFQRELMADVQ